MKKSLRFSHRPDLPVILQDEVAECGLTCVAMISNYLGHEIDLYSLRLLAGTSLKGTTLATIIELCKRIDLKTRALRIDMDDLIHLKTPAILHWNMNHFVVLKKATKKYLIIHDPALGVKKINYEEAAKAFTGIALEVERAITFEAIHSKINLSLLDVVKHFTGLKKAISTLLGLSFCIELLSLMNPQFIQFAIDSMSTNRLSNDIYVIAIGFTLLIIIQTFTEWVRSKYIIYFSNHINHQFSSNVVNHLLKLPLSYFQKRHKGDIQSRFQSIDQIQRKITTDFINTVLDGILIIITLCLMVIYSGYLSLIVVISLVVFISIRSYSFYELKKLSALSLSSHARAASDFLETLAAMLPIKNYAKEQSRLAMWQNHFVKALNSDIGIANKNLIYSAANKLIFNIELMIIICVGTNMILNNQLSIGMLIAYLAYRQQLIEKSTTFIHSIFDYRLLAVQLSRLSDILINSPEVVTSSHLTITSKTVSLKADNLSFSYDHDGKYVFKNFSISVKPGEKVAITGPSGIGKSTLLKVLMGLLTPDKGTISVNDMRLEVFGLKNYREICASVMQDDALMSGSILQNIAFFDEQIDYEKIIESAKIANIHHDIIKLPMAYETLVGDMGSVLSGGQKQRVLLARALYKDPKIIFLDEATSHLDSSNEIVINRLLKELPITQITIAHRKETIEMADRVIELNHHNFQ